MRHRLRVLVGFVFVSFLSFLGACQRSEPELLVVYSGDGQGYIEPCG